MIANSVTACFIDTNVWLYAFIEADMHHSLLVDNQAQIVNPFVAT